VKSDVKEYSESSNLCSSTVLARCVVTIALLEDGLGNFISLGWLGEKRTQSRQSLKNKYAVFSAGAQDSGMSVNI
jgi:hypothetical protein